MWKKDDMPEKAGQPTPGPAAPIRSEPSRPSSTGPTERASIGRSITIRGDVTGDEDLLIQGRIEGTVDLKQHSVTIGPEGRVKADITGRTVTVEGQVDGDLRADEQVVLRGSSRVHGDVVAPRVVIEDGATFRGSVDMESKAAEPGGRPRSGPKLHRKGGEAATSAEAGDEAGTEKEGAAS